jgi:hypothetical protein
MDHCHTSPGGQVTISRGILSTRCPRSMLIWVSCLASFSVISKSSDSILVHVRSVETGRHRQMRSATTVTASFVIS